MPNYRRVHKPGGSYFFTVNLARRGSSLLVEGIAELRAAYRAAWRERPFRTEAIVVLPDHLHAVWTLPDGDAEYSLRWGAIKGRFSQAMRRAGFIPPDPVGRENGGVNPALRRKGEIGLWQPRFWEHSIRDRRDFEMHIRYCWTNPVKHGLADRAVDWPYSSIHRDIRAGRAGPEWVGDDIDGEFGE